MEQGQARRAEAAVQAQGNLGDQDSAPAVLPNSRPRTLQTSVSMRRTNASLVYRRTRNLRAVQLLLGHTKLESTVRYLGIEVEDALEIAEQTEA